MRTIELYDGKFGYFPADVGGLLNQNILVWRDDTEHGIKYCGWRALRAAAEYAKARGLWLDPEDAYNRKAFGSWLQYLNDYAEHRQNRRCLLSRDSWAPYSFNIEYMVDGEHWWNGGLIYHGPRDGALGVESMSVRIGPDASEEWCVHT